MFEDHDPGVEGVLSKGLGFLVRDSIPLYRAWNLEVNLSNPFQLLTKFGQNRSFSQ